MRQRLGEDPDSERVVGPAASGDLTGPKRRSGRKAIMPRIWRFKPCVRETEHEHRELAKQADSDYRIEGEAPHY
jgi:hypothetical protein